jgi:GTPase SAR1 family protein
MGARLTTYLCCACCQRPGCCCCCENLCRHTLCGNTLLGCAEFFPIFTCCRMPIEKTVLLVGRRGVGKTYLLYSLLFRKSDAMINLGPTKGFNNEVVPFNAWQKYEFWDLGGSEVQRPLWKKFYQRIQFDFVVYVVDGDAFRRVKSRDNPLGADRMELHTLLNEIELSKQKFIVYINFRAQPESGTRREVEEELELQEYKNIHVVDTIDALKSELGVHDPEKAKSQSAAAVRRAKEKEHEEEEEEEAHDEYDAEPAGDGAPAEGGGPSSAGEGRP